RSPLMTLGKLGVSRGFVGDRVVVIGGDRTAHADGADDLPILDDGHGAAAGDERVVAERGDGRREELATLAEALLELERRRAESRGGVFLRPGAPGRDPA